MATIKAGTYRFNDVLTAPSERLEEQVDFSFGCIIPLIGIEVNGQCTRVLVTPELVSYYVVATEPDLQNYGFPVQSYVAAYALVGVYPEFDGWNDYAFNAGIQTISIPNDTEVSSEFYEWFNANAVEVVDGVQISGVWKFKDVLTAPSADLEQTVKFSATITVEGTEAIYHCESITAVVPDMGQTELQYYVAQLEGGGQMYPLEEDVTSYYDGWGEFTGGAPLQTINFGTEPQTVSAEFYHWLTGNATQPSASIQYNGSTIANLFGGQTATLKCAGMRMETDVVVEAKELPEIPKPVLQEKTVTENGEVLPDDGYDGLSKVTVAVESSGGGLAINGIIEQYKVNAGATVNAGDFVEFVTKFGSGGFNSGAAVFVVAEKIDNSRVLVAYEDDGNSYNLTAVVLTIDSGTVTVGAPLALTSYTSDQLNGRTNITVLSDSKALVCNTYANSSYMIMLVSISGTTIRKVGNLTLNTASTYTAIAALSENTVIVAHSLIEDSKYQTALTVLTISENTITKTSQKIVSSYQTAYGISLTVLTESTLLFTFADYTNKCYKAAVVSVYDGVVTCGSFKTISSGIAYYPDAVRCADNKVLVVYSDGSNSNYGTAIVLTVDGTTVTAGTPVVFRSIGYNTLSASVSALTDNKVVAVYRGDSGHGTAVILTVDGSTITVGAPTECDLNYTSGHAVVAFGEGSALAIFNNGAGIYCGLTIDGTTITSDGEMATYVKPATSRLHNVGVAATGGAEGETVDVYVVG